MSLTLGEFFSYSAKINVNLRTVLSVLGVCAYFVFISAILQNGVSTDVWMNLGYLLSCLVCVMCVCFMCNKRVFEYWYRDSLRKATFRMLSLDRNEMQIRKVNLFNN